MTGDTFAQNTTGNYANNIKHRAFGGTGQMDYNLPNSETAQIKLEYDTRLRVSHSEVSKSSTNYQMKADFSYAADSRVTAKNDLLDDKWDRTMKYDFGGRLTFNQFGLGPNANNTGTKRVYEQTVAYDAFSQITSRGGAHWDANISFAATYTNGRKNALTGEIPN